MYEKAEHVYIHNAICKLVTRSEPNLVRTIVQQFAISRQAVHKYINKMVANGYLIKSGSTRAIQYSLGPRRWLMQLYPITEKLEENVVWEQDIRPLLNDIPENVKNICHYGTTEIINNAIDHSGGKDLFICLSVKDENIFLSVIDDGEGIFKHIARLKNLDDERLSILELSKGKFTTDNVNHTGEGIFFSSHAFDYFAIFSHDLTFRRGKDSIKNHLEYTKKITEETTVMMVISKTATTELKDVFDRYTTYDDQEGLSFFDRTDVPVRLAAFEGGTLISRSQAKRVTRNLEKFNYITFDFLDIDNIGQAFADQIFRVFQNEHPKTQLTFINVNDEIKKMILRVKNNVVS